MRHVRKVLSSLTVAATVLLGASACTPTPVSMTAVSRGPTGAPIAVVHRCEGAPVTYISFGKSSGSVGPSGPESWTVVGSDLPSGTSEVPLHHIPEGWSETVNSLKFGEGKFVLVVSMNRVEVAGVPFTSSDLASLGTDQVWVFTPEDGGNKGRAMSRTEFDKAAAEGCP